MFSQAEIVRHTFVNVLQIRLLHVGKAEVVTTAVQPYGDFYGRKHTGNKQYQYKNKIQSPVKMTTVSNHILN